MQVSFVNRERELEALERWWERGDALGIVWGRRRVGKTWLVGKFASTRLSVVHTAGDRAAAVELEILSKEVARARLAGTRDLTARAFASWDEALDALSSAAASRSEPVLLVLDEFPALLSSEPSLESLLRAFVERSLRPPALRILLCGSAVRTMQRMQEERAPLYGRFGLRLPVHPFEPHETALMLADIDPPTRALVWGIVGGVPLYLSWWDQSLGVEDNLHELVLSPGARLLDEGHLVLATEGDAHRLAGPLLSAIASGRTKFSELADAVRTDPTRSLDRLVEMRLVERLVPITEDPRRSRKRIYHIGDNFLAFWLTLVDPYRTEIDRGLGPSIASSLIDSLDGFMGPRWEEAFRCHLRRLAARGDFGSAVAIGRWWVNDGAEIDAVVLAGRERVATVIGEAKWARHLDAHGAESSLLQRAGRLPKVASEVRLALCAREEVTGAGPHTLTVTAADIFGIEGE